MSDDKVKVPGDLQEAMEILYDDASEEDLERIRAEEEKDFSGEQHSNAGLWIRNQWNLWDKESEFMQYLSDLLDLPTPELLPHPDDLSGRILEVFHRYVRDPDIDPEAEFKGVVRH